MNFQVRCLVGRHVDSGPVVEARHQHLQQEIGDALLHPRKYPSQVRNLGRFRSLHLHDIQPHQVRHHQRRPRHHSNARPSCLLDQDERQPGVNVDQIFFIFVDNSVMHFHPSFTFEAEACGRVVHCKAFFEISRYAENACRGQTLRLTGGGNTERMEGLVQ